MRSNTFWPPIELLWGRVRKNESGCWEWITLDGRPFTREPVMQYRGQQVRPRRWVWTVIHRREPAKKMHTECGNVACVNPAHHTERLPGRRCRLGHPMTGENLILNPTTKRRYCRICHQIHSRTPEQRLKAQARSRAFSERNQEAERVRLRLHQQRKTLLRRIDKESLHWSPSTNRWLIFEDERWVRSGDSEAVVLLGALLRTAGIVPNGEDAGRKAIHSSLAMLRNLSRPLDEGND